MDTQLEQPSFIERGIAHVFRESKGHGHGTFFWGLGPQTPSSFANQSENQPGSAPESGGGLKMVAFLVKCISFLYLGKYTYLFIVNTY